MAKDVVSARKQIRKKKPKFAKQNSSAFKRLTKSWRKPRGTHSKIRLGIAGKRPKVKSGYRTPINLRDINPKGLIEVNISKLSDLAALNKSKHSIVISRTLGLKKKLDLAKKVAEKGFAIANTDLKSLESKLKIKKEKAKAKKEKKSKKKPEEKKKEEKPKEKKEEKPKEKKEEKPKEEKKEVKKEEKPKPKKKTPAGAPERSEKATKKEKKQ
jgi:large subunit ribosomal protein L32e